MAMLGLPETTAYKFLNDTVEMQEKGEKVPFKVLKIAEASEYRRSPLTNGELNVK